MVDRETTEYFMREKKPHKFEDLSDMANFLKECIRDCDNYDADASKNCQINQAMRNAIASNDKTFRHKDLFVAIGDPYDNSPNEFICKKYE